MAFQIKDFASISAAIINHMRGTTTKITDFQPGSVARTLVEGPAVEIEELYLQMFLGLREAIPVATFLSFGFDKLPAMYARGFVSISTDAAPADAWTIPAGTEFSTEDGRTYLSTEAVQWPAGEQTVRVPVAASAAGLSYNVAQGVITQSPAFNDSYTISNAPISNGRDVEGDDEQEARFAEFVASLSRGTVAACEYAASQARVLDEDGQVYEYVTRLGLSETPGFVRIYVYTSRGVASPALLSVGQRIIDGWRDEATGARTPGYRSGGVRVDVLPMIERAVPFTVGVTMLPGYSLTAAVRQDMADAYATALESVQPGETLYVGEIETALLGVTGVRAVVPSATENIVCGVFEVLVPGVLTVSPL